MAWIESHTVILRHRKTVDLATALHISPVLAVGHLHVLWHTVLEQQEDGDLSRWSVNQIAAAAQYRGDARRFVRALQGSGWLDGRLVHDWLDYAGRYLELRYRTHKKEKLAEIWLKHGQTFLGQTKDGPGTAYQTKPTIPTKPTKSGWMEVCAKLGENLPAEKKLAWADWIKHRLDLKKPISEAGAEKQLRFLNSQGDFVECINQSIRNGWQGLFPLKANRNEGQASRAFDNKTPKRERCDLCGFTGTAKECLDHKCVSPRKAEPPVDPAKVDAELARLKTELKSAG